MRRSAGGAGAIPSRASRSRTKASIGWLTPATVGGSVARSGSKAHQSRPPRESVVRSNGSRCLPSGQPAPAAIQSRRAAISASGRLRATPFFAGGISPAITRARRGLAAGSPGATTAPESPPARRPSARERSSPPEGSLAPWHSRQRRRSTSPAPVSKSAAAALPAARHSGRTTIKAAAAEAARIRTCFPIRSL